MLRRPTSIVQIDMPASTSFGGLVGCLFLLNTNHDFINVKLKLWHFTRNWIWYNTLWIIQRFFPSKFGNDYGSCSCRICIWDKGSNSPGHWSCRDPLYICPMLFFFFYLLNHPVYIYCQRHDILKAIKVVRKIQNSFEKKITSEHIITNELFSKTVSSLIIRSVNQQEKTTT